MATFHINGRGEVDRCRARKGGCPFGGETGLDNHYGTEEEAHRAFEERMESSLIHGPLSKTVSQNFSHFNSGKGFAMDSYYGEKPPRSIQLDAMNGVVKALEEEDQTQLVAACGTGKTYMGRQILNHEMEKEGANGVAVILTSSIKLAEDTAQGMRPGKNGYDHAFGTFGEDYEVIEVHSGARMQSGRKSVLTKGKVDIDRIHDQIKDAKDQGKKVIIVSTYDSCDKVQEAQQRFSNGEADADILMADEAHNILGQQTPTGKVSEESLRSAYTGFHNDIPGAIQSKKRLYATATPVIKETDSDKDSSATVEEAVRVAQNMKKNKKLRVTFYSNDTDIVGGIGGYISQHEAIDANCLSKPDYQIRDTALNGDSSKFNDPVVEVDGTLKERIQGESALEPTTYASINSTLQAMVSDDHEGNAVHNVLAYTGSINQSDAFAQNFKKVALAQSNGISLKEAEANVNSDDEELRKASRMRLLAEHAEVKSAHSKSRKPEKEAAFGMFKGKSLTEDQAKAGWSPNKRVLANVDIFSEGVSISEIDTVVINDDDKLSERAMTQAIGRSLRKVGGNDYKTTGHVIIPQVSDSKGKVLNQASVNNAAYGATRVERGVSTAKIRGDGVSPDEKTTFTHFDAKGRRSGTEKAREISQKAVSSVDQIVAAYEVDKIHQFLSKSNEDSAYRDMSAGEQANMIKTGLREKLERPSTNRSDRRNILKTLEKIEKASPQDLRNLRRNRKVLVSSMAAGDISALSSGISSALMKTGIMVQGNGDKVETTVDEKREFLKKHKSEMLGAIVSNPAEMTNEHKRVRTAFPKEFFDKKGPYMKEGMLRANRRGSDTEATKKMDSIFEKRLENEDFVNTAFAMSRFSKDGGKSAVPLFRNKTISDSINSSHSELEEERHRREQEAAAAGKSAYTFNSSKVRKDGEISSNAVKELANEIWGEP